MAVSLLKIIALGLVQGATELLPVSSSAHVVVAEKLMGLDPTSPEMTFLIVMLHTGTLFAVIAYFRKAWRRSYLASPERFRSAAAQIALATAYTLAVGFGLMVVIEKVVAFAGEGTEVEQLFGNLYLIAAALAAVGVLILASARRDRRKRDREDVTLGAACWIGIAQGFSIPFRGFSRSGSTISTGLLCGAGRRRAEEFSFALVVVITPLAIARELARLLRANAYAAEPAHVGALLLPGVVGMIASFGAGLLALKLLSRWLEGGRWSYFGAYCLGAAVAVFALACAGF